MGDNKGGFIHLKEKETILEHKEHFLNFQFQPCLYLQAIKLLNKYHFQAASREVVIVKKNKMKLKLNDKMRFFSKTIGIGSFNRFASTMKAFRVHNYSENEEFAKVDDVEIPKPKPNQILLKVKACSINPIDIMMKKGYARSFLELYRKPPFVLGVDCAGLFSPQIFFSSSLLI